MSLLKKSDFIRGLISIGVVAVLLTAFELALYYIIIEKEFRHNINTLLFKSHIHDLEAQPGGNTIMNIIEGIAINERSLADYVNDLKMWIIILEILFIFIITVFFYTKLKREAKWDIYGTNFSPTAINIFIIFIILMGFQLFIFLFAHDYVYGTSEEMNIRIVNGFLKAKGEELIKIPSGTSLTKV